MKKNIIRYLSVLLMCILFIQNVCASDKEVKKDYAAETIGTVPKQFQKMVNGNWVNTSGIFSNDGYYSFNSVDGQVKIDKYSVYGKKLYSTEYDYKYAGKDKNGVFDLLYFRHQIPYVNLVCDNGDTFFSSRVLRSIPLLHIELSSKHNLVKVDSTGKVIWEKNFKAKDVFLIRGMVEAEDGSLILGVTKQTKWINAALGDYKVSLIKLSADGEIIKKVDLREGITMIDNMVYVDGRGFMGMTTEIIGDDDDYEKKNYLNAFDNDLNLLWEYEIDSTFYPWDKENVSENGYPIRVKKNVDTPLYEKKKRLLSDLNLIKILFLKILLKQRTKMNISTIFSF